VFCLSRAKQRESSEVVPQNARIDLLPYAVGSRAAAPSRLGFGLLGRNAAERAKKKSAGFSLFRSLP
jgi:hypothetical protein